MRRDHGDRLEDHPRGLITKPQTTLIVVVRDSLRLKLAITDRVDDLKAIDVLLLT